MLFSDAKSQWDPDLLSDARVTHYWDPDLSIGRWFDANEDQIGFEFNKGPIVWDPTSSSDRKPLGPAHPHHSFRTATRSSLRERGCSKPPKPYSILRRDVGVRSDHG